MAKIYIDKLQYVTFISDLTEYMVYHNDLDRTTATQDDWDEVYNQIEFLTKTKLKVYPNERTTF